MPFLKGAGEIKMTEDRRREPGVMLPYPISVLRQDDSGNSPNVTTFFQ